MQRKVPADQWTAKNIDYMRKQLNDLAISFDWSREISTCDPDYYKWTQWLFLQLYKEGLAYQSEVCDPFKLLRCGLVERLSHFRRR